MHLEWDDEKDRANQAKHGLGFAEASDLFTSGADYAEIFDDLYPGGEERFIAIGPIKRGVIVVVFTERVDDVVRVISARFAKRDEVKAYREFMREK